MYDGELSTHDVTMLHSKQQPIACLLAPGWQQDLFCIPPNTPGSN